MQFSLREGALTPRIFASLREECGLAPLDAAQVCTAIKNSLFTLTAFVGARPVGMVRMVGDGAFVFLIYDLLVTPPARRNGLGELLVKTALHRAARMLPNGLWVTVGLFSAEGKESFYRRLGFSELPGGGLGAGMQIIFRAGEDY